MEEQPRPVILDPNSRTQLSKLLSLVSVGHAHSPWILCKREKASSHNHIPLEMKGTGFLWSDILSALSDRGIKSVMIEGGATVINDVLSRKVADVIIITIAPVFLGTDGIGVNAVMTEEWLEDIRTLLIGNDVVIAGRVRK
jgi:2,5-diamino-6-(ribosylamino)-4(3H)-pyrimidinone 5'-phosphate reductase